MQDKAEIGRLGEEATVAWLQRHGFRIVERNWRAGRYEVDIIAERAGELHIVEVKCRARGGLTGPGDAYTGSKLAALHRAAEAYIEQNGTDAEVHFDLASVTHCGGRFEVEYIPDAVPPRW
ncbi:MAG: YraN family protein [Alistipes sp.]|nr:YraN family protein [Alistipes sp.]